MHIDLTMPHRDGMETLRLIRAVQPTLRVIILTGLLSDAEQAEAKKWGVTAVALKPVSIKALLQTIAERLEDSHGNS